ncbi:LOW QUALITY PROTEIN: hypothetical protein ElyMa_000705900 [Elysia marginata]|uniref:Cadherin domain-containing protein n=1 Tax=Elysia marginata TaxID=1093978 RepID=A0AAV4GK34_9GAST|nr:LOW QUALITY PROTEIN: hypothetical protein ElyMa_000705900 [Elysia marginata]
MKPTDDGIPANLTVLLADVELNEKEDARTQLGAGPVVTCVEEDGDQVRAYVQSISPSSGCATRCLQLEPCGGGNDFCLWFLGNSVLYYSTVSLYTLTIGCTDDVEAAVTQDISVTIVPNSPPTFDPDNPPYAAINIHGQKTSHDARHELYKVETIDTEDDPRYYTMSLSPLTDLIEIEYGNRSVIHTQYCVYVIYDN